MTLRNGDWPCWRGSQGNGVAFPNQHPPLHWSKDENVLWTAEIPGRGHSSPTVVGDRVLLTTAEEEKEIQSVVCCDRATGRQLWKTEVHRGGLDHQGEQKNLASLFHDRQRRRAALLQLPQQRRRLHDGLGFGRQAGLAKRR